MLNYIKSLSVKNLKYVMLAIFGLVILIKLYQNHTSPSFPLSQTSLVDLNNQAVEFDYKQTPFTIVAFFQTWCRDCVSEIPELEHFMETQPYGKVRVILVSDEPLDKLKEFKYRRKVKFHIYQSEKKLKDLGIHVFPTTYLINKYALELLVKREGFEWASDPEVKALLNQTP